MWHRIVNEHLKYEEDEYDRMNAYNKCFFIPVIKKNTIRAWYDEWHN